MILSFFDPLRNPLSFFDPLRDPLKDNAIVPQKYVEALERQGWIRPVKCGDCMYWCETGEGFGEREMLEIADSDPEITHAFQTDHDWFCANGERADAPACGPDYCEIGGGDDADGETPLSR